MQAQNETVNLTAVSLHQLPFNVTATPDQTSINATCTTTNTSATNTTNSTTRCPIHNKTIRLTAAIPDGFDPGNYTGQAVLQFTDRASQFYPLEIQVPAVRNWTITNVSTRSALTVGTSGTLLNLTLVNTGNDPVQLFTNFTGNLTASQPTINPTYPIYPKQPEQLSITYDVPPETQFGRYIGRIAFTDDQTNKTQAVNLSTRFIDSIDPRLIDIRVNDMMATKTQDLTVLGSDNLAIDQVQGVIQRETTRQVNNTSIRVNRTVTTLDFDEKAGGVWSESLTTDYVGLHWISATVKDSANNTVVGVEQFNVTKLDVVSVVNDNFRFNETPPTRQMRSPVLEIEDSTEVAVTLEQFDYQDPDSTVWIGLAKEGEEVSEKFDRLSLPDMIDVSGTGTYELVVESDTAQMVTGHLDVSTDGPHTPLEDIDFRGAFNQSRYPSPTTWQIGRFNGSLSYNEGNASESNRVKFVGWLPIDAVKGCRFFDGCIAGVNLGEYRRVKRVNERLETNNSKQSRQKWAAIIVGGILVGMIFRKQQVKHMVTSYRGFPPSHYEGGIVKTRAEVESENSGRNDGSGPPSLGILDS